MPLVVQADGTVSEGAIPPGGTTVIVLHDGELKEAFVEQGQAVAPSGDVVTRERLQYDRPEVVPSQTVRDALATRASESVRAQREFVIAALLARAEETNPTPVETIRSNVRATELAVVPIQTDTQMIALRASETLPTIGERHSLTLNAAEGVSEQIETIRITPVVMAFEAVPLIAENIAAAIIEQGNTLPTITVTEPVEANLTGYANAVVANTSWTNPNNSLGNTTGTAATLAAASSGVAGTTNNTTTGSLTLGFQDVRLGDLTISNVDLFVENQGATAGVAIAQPTTNVQWQYSLDGTTFTTFYTMTTPATAKGIRTIDITALVGQDNAKLSALQIRATGSVTSGTGLGATNTVSFFRAWMVVNAARTY
jgi:hypothetical protein